MPKTDGPDYEEGHAYVLHWREYGVRQKNGGGDWARFQGLSDGGRIISQPEEVMEAILRVGKILDARKDHMAKHGHRYVGI